MDDGGKGARPLGAHDLRVQLHAEERDPARRRHAREGASVRTDVLDHDAVGPLRVAGSRQATARIFLGRSPAREAASLNPIEAPRRA